MRRNDTPTKTLSVAVPEKVYEGIKEVATENDITMRKAVSSILLGYLKSRAARKAKEEANDQ